MAIERKISPTHEAPCRGLRVLDFGQGIASPYCAMLLGVYGADVIKVEPPEGDWSRFLGTPYGSHTTLSAVYNRGKRSVCLDMKHKDGIAIARRLAKNCDVLIEGFRPGVAARLGIGYEELSRDNPGLIYLSVSAFGQSGPYSKRPGPIPSHRRSPVWCRSMSAMTAPRIGSAPRFPTSSPASTPSRPSQRRCLRARPSAPGAGSTSTSANRRLPCSATRWPNTFWRAVHRGRVEATRAAVCQQTPGVGPVYSPRTPGIASFSEDDLRPAPDIGQDSYEVLLEAGFERGAIDDLVRAGAVRQAKGGTA